MLASQWRIPGAVYVDNRWLIAEGNKLLSKIGVDDYALLVYCMRGYTIQEIAKRENISPTKAKRKLGNLYDRLCVTGKKDPIETYTSAMSQPITKITQ